jgi:hypothetical protein
MAKDNEYVHRSNYVLDYAKNIDSEIGFVDTLHQLLNVDPIIGNLLIITIIQEVDVVSTFSIR